MAKRLIIILGYGLANDGSVQPILKSRLDKAISIYQKTDTLLVCGKYPPKATVPMRCEITTEAEAMKQYLVNHDIPAGNIFKEEQSATTFGNALFSYFILLQEAATYQSIIIISNEFHEPLVKYSFDKVFGNRYPYIFHAVPDATLGMAPEEIEQWKYIVNQLVERCYPLLFSEVENGDINAIQSIIEGHQRTIFESSVKSLLHLDETVDIVIASETEILTVNPSKRCEI